MKITVRMGVAGNGVPAFIIAETRRDLERPFGASWDGSRHLWMYPAYYPASRKVLADFSTLSRRADDPINFEFSESALQYIQKLDETERRYQARELPEGFSFVTKPFEHQVLGLAHVFYFLRSALFYDPGLGKSKIAIDLIRLQHYLGKKSPTLVLGPLVTVRNWGAEIDRHSGGELRWGAMLGTPKEKTAVVERAAAGEFDVLILTYDTASRYVDMISQKVDYKTVIADECFPARTLVLTDQGDVPIETVAERPADYRVLTGEARWQRVTRGYKRPLKRRLVRVRHTQGSFVCTENHRVWTEEEGYVEAISLSGKTLCVVRENVLVSQQREEGSRSSTFLQSQLFGTLADAGPETARDSAPSCEEDARRGAMEGRSCGPMAFVHSHVSEQSHVDARGHGKNARQENRSDILGARRQWATDSTAIEISCGVGLADGSSHRDSGGQGPVRFAADVLQSGSGECTEENRYRGRWSDAQNQEMEVLGPPQDGGFGSSRVDRVEILESGSYGGFAEGYAADSFVYDLEVEEDHNYFAEGVLVSNSHLIKTWTSARTRAAYELGQKAVRKVIMTGTPTLGNPLDLYGQFKFLADAFVPEGYVAFKRRYLETRGPNSHVVIGYKNLDVLNARTQFVSLRKTKEECLDLPERTIIDLEYDLSRHQKAVYNQMVAEMKIDLDLLLAQLGGTATDALPPETALPHRAAMLQKLLQICSGFLITNPDTKLCDTTEVGGCRYLMQCVAARITPYTPGCKVAPEEPPDIVTVFDENPKLAALLELLDTILANPSNKVIVWAYFSRELDFLEEKIKALGVQVTRVDGKTGQRIQGLVDTFNSDPEQRVYLAQVSTGVGITVNSATYTIYYSLPYSLGSYLQSIDRNYRIGQKNAVTVYRLLGKQTIEPSIVKLLDNKIDVDQVLTQKLNCIVCPRALACIADNVSLFDPDCIHKRNMARPVTKAMRVL